MTQREAPIQRGIVVLEVPGKPFGKQRPTFGKGRVYTPGQTVNFEQQVGLIANRHFPTPIEGPVRLTIRATFETPKSWSKRKTASLINRHHTQKPDGDNVLKAICDGLNRIAWADDSQVADKRVVKMWGPTARTVIEIEAIT